MRESIGIEASSAGWKRARQGAFVHDALLVFGQRPASLLDFEQVSQKLQLANVNYLALQEVPLAQIVGSVGRYADFTRAFLPRKDHLRERWQRIERMLNTGRPLPPIELYKVGQIYFVRDGNHRVSVARQRGLDSLPALVWEYETDIPLTPDSDVDELLCQVAHAAFMAQTGLDRLRPDLALRLTQPDGYQDLLAEIEDYQRVLSEIDRRPIPLDEAVMLWCDLRYEPIVTLMRERYALQEFPGRTEADLYLWLCLNRQELEDRYDQRVLMDEAADDLTRRFGENFLPIRQLRRITARTAARVRERAARLRPK